MKNLLLTTTCSLILAASATHADTLPAVEAYPMAIPPAPAVASAPAPVAASTVPLATLTPSAAAPAPMAAAPVAAAPVAAPAPVPFINEGEHLGWYTQFNVFDTVLADANAKYTDPTVPLLKANGGDGEGAGIAVGYRIMKDIRLEGEVAYRHSQVEVIGLHGASNSLAGMANIYSDISTGTRFTPYVGVGAGAVKNNDSKDTVGAFQGMTGVSYALASETSLVLGYKYFQAVPSPKYDVGAPYTAKVPYRTHNVELGLRYSFQ